MAQQANSAGRTPVAQDAGVAVCGSSCHLVRRWSSRTTKKMSVERKDDGSRDTVPRYNRGHHYQARAADLKHGGPRHLLAQKSSSSKRGDFESRRRNTFTRTRYGLAW